MQILMRNIINIRLRANTFLINPQDDKYLPSNTIESHFEHISFISIIFYIIQTSDSIVEDMNYFNMFGLNYDLNSTYMCVPTTLNSINMQSLTNLIQIEENPSIQKENVIAQLLKQNEELKKKCQILENQQNHEEKRPQGVKNTKRKLIRRKQDELNKKFNCIYGSCRKSYASKLALNLHIKIKHNGRSKRKMDEQAKKIILAEIKGESVSPEINFPEGYLENYKDQNFTKLHHILFYEGQLRESSCSS